MPDTYVYRNGAFIHKRTGEPMAVPPRDGVCCPRVHSDIQEYRSPIDGTLIGSGALPCARPVWMSIVSWST